MGSTKKVVPGFLASDRRSHLPESSHRADWIDMTNQTRPRNGPRTAALCLSLATLLYLRQIAMWAVPRNRFYTHWQRVDTLMLALSLLAVALVFYLIALIVRRASWGSMVLRWLSIVLLADILVGYLASGRIGGHPAIFTAAWVILAGVGIHAASRPRVLERGTTLLATFAWLAPISLVQMLLWKPWDVRPVVRPDLPRPAPASRTPVFLFVFDEWSHQRSYDGSELLPFFHNLRKLARHSFEFADAHSQAGATNPSVPRIIFQRDGVVRPKNGIAVWEQGDSTVPSARVPSIFAAAKSRGYRTWLAGFYFPYRALLGDQVDHIVHQAYVPKGQRVSRQLALVTARNLEFLADPLSRVLWRRWDIPRTSENWFYINRTWRSAVRDLIRGSDKNTFGMVHWPLPHGPWVLNEDGSYRGPFKKSRVEGTPGEYQKHLAFLDLVLGEAMASLDSADLLDQSLVIVTSDHSWKTDPDSSLREAPGARTWVPLFIKLPNQTAGYRISERFCLGQLGALLQRVMDTTLTELNGRSELVKLPSSSSCTRREDNKRWARRGG
jgi:Sulfatase